MSTNDEALNQIQEAFIRETEANKGLPDEISLLATVNDDEIVVALMSALHEYIFRTDDPLGAFAHVVQTFSEQLIENMEDFNTSNPPRLREAWRKRHAEVQRQRAMYLQWKELNDIETVEDNQ